MSPKEIVSGDSETPVATPARRSSSSGGVDADALPRSVWVTNATAAFDLPREIVQAALGGAESDDVPYTREEVQTAIHDFMEQPASGGEV